ncbi:hypothetical protein ACHAWO_010815 [Cyclotella atomus]|uniref:Uncharacterized protein n=1 Tax=Cyclotella atomus TaxID=382360 RepID=A0ABD3P4L5_9STRA
MMLSRLRLRLRPRSAASRALGMKAAPQYEPPLPPHFSMDAIAPPPHGLGSPTTPDVDPMAIVRQPVTAAHAVDLPASRLSALDSAAFTSDGKAEHARFGKLGDAAASVPLEYLALLRPAAEGAAALREVGAAPGSTVLVYGASRPSGLAAVQLASSMGCAVAAVVDGQHSGSDEMVDAVKGLTREPGFAVAEEYALCKASFRDEVLAAVRGEGGGGWDSAAFLEEFQRNLVDYAEHYPADLPAAVDAQQLKFEGKEKDRANFKVNMEAYLSQYMPGSPPIDAAALRARFDADQYELFKRKFGRQTSAVISGGDGVMDVTRFNPPEIVSRMIDSPEEGASDDDSNDYPFEFSIKHPPRPTTPTVQGGPIAGLIIEATPELVKAATAVSKANTLRQKAEALQFLTDGERNAHAAAASLVKLAKDANAPIRVVNGALPGFTSVSANEEDVQTALDAMAIGEDGEEAKLNYFVQVYRANDFPAYEAYGVFRAGEECTLRSVVVTK